MTKKKTHAVETTYVVEPGIAATTRDWLNAAYFARRLDQPTIEAHCVSRAAETLGVTAKPPPSLPEVDTPATADAPAVVLGRQEARVNPPWCIVFSIPPGKTIRAEGLRIACRERPIEIVKVDSTGTVDGEQYVRVYLNDTLWQKMLPKLLNDEIRIENTHPTDTAHVGFHYRYMDEDAPPKPQAGIQHLGTRIGKERGPIHGLWSLEYEVPARSSVNALGLFLRGEKQTIRITGVEHVAVDGHRVEEVEFFINEVDWTMRLKGTLNNPVFLANDMLRIVNRSPVFVTVTILFRESK